MENKILLAKRQEPANPSHIGNPLLEALFDQLSAEEFYKYIVQGGPLKRREILSLDPRIRSQHLDDIRVNFLIPNRRLYSVYELIHSSINNSYALRNPLKNPIKSNVQRDYRDFTTQLKNNFEPTFSSSSMIVGVSGIGKTTSINLVSALFPPALLHTDINGETITQIPIVKIECPKDGSIKDLCRYFFIELDRILGQRRYELEYIQKRDNANDRVVAMSKLVAAHCVGVLIVDEIQHLSQAKSGGRETMLNFFLNLDNTLHIPIIVVGTPETIELFSEKQRLRRRFTAGAAFKWDRLPNDYEWNTIIKQLFKYQYTEEEADPLVNWSSIFYNHALGIIDRAIKIFISAQKLAFKIQAKSITIDIVDKAVKNTLWIDEDIFQSIREGKLNLSRAQDLFLPEEETDKMENYRLINIQNQLLDFKIPENFSFPLIEGLINKDPIASDTEIAFEIIKSYNLDNEKSRVNSPNKSIKLKTNHVNGDLRKCDPNDTSALHKQLKDLGVLADLENYMI